MDVPKKCESCLPDGQVSPAYTDSKRGTVGVAVTVLADGYTATASQCPAHRLDAHLVITGPDGEVVARVVAWPPLADENDEDEFEDEDDAEDEFEDELDDE